MNLQPSLDHFKTLQVLYVEDDTVIRENVGASKVNGVSKEDQREGFIAALSFGIPLTPDQSLKCSYVWAKTQTDIETRSSTDTFTLGWSIRF